MTDFFEGRGSLERDLHASGEVSESACAEFASREDLSAALVAALGFVGCPTQTRLDAILPTSTAEQRVGAARLMMLKFRVETGEPVWSSWALERALTITMSTAGGSPVDGAQCLVDLMVDYDPPLGPVLITFVRDFTVLYFTQYRTAYDSADWVRVVEAFRRGPTAAAAYLVALLLPDELLMSCDSEIRRVLQGSPYVDEVIDLLS